MDKEEIYELYNSVKDIPQGIPNEIWRKAFAFYKADTGNHLGMGCFPCYSKVLNHIAGKLNAMGEDLPYVVPRTRPLKTFIQRMAEEKKKRGMI